MKTAISVPDDLFKKGETTARRLKMSRSQLYATALEKFLRDQEGEAITAKLNEVYSREPARVDPAFKRATAKVLDPW